MGYNNDTAVGCLGAIVAFLGIFGIWALLTLIFAWPVQLLWNWLVPALFSGPEVTIWQALGLEVLIGLLFGRSSVVNSNNNK